jgi:hypothetical protein
VPVAVVEAALTLKVEPVVELTGENAAVAPVGRPVTVKATLLANPLIGTMLTASVALAPGATVRLGAAGVSVKVDAPVTTRGKLSVAVELPDVPVMVSG